MRRILVIIQQVTAITLCKIKDAAIDLGTDVLGAWKSPKTKTGLPIGYTEVIGV